MTDQFLQIVGGCIVGVCLPSVTKARYWIGILGLVMAVLGTARHFS
jgi:hypothetical protein